MSAHGQFTIGSRQLVQLIEICEHGSIRRAAESLGMTQPGLSKNIRQIEARLGIELFDRHSGGARPTALGRMVIDRGRQILCELDSIERDLIESCQSRKSRVVIGTGPALAPLIFSVLTPLIANQYSDLELDIRVDLPADLIISVANGDCDFAICSTDGIELPPNVSTQLITLVHPVLFVRRGHPLTRHFRVSATDLADFRLATPPLTKRARDWWGTITSVTEVHFGLQSNDMHLIGEVVANSDMVSMAHGAVLALLQSKFDLVALDVPDIDFDHSIYLIESNVRAQSRAAREVRRVATAAITQWSPVAEPVRAKA